MVQYNLKYKVYHNHTKLFVIICLYSVLKFIMRNKVQSYVDSLWTLNSVSFFLEL